MSVVHIGYRIVAGPSGTRREEGLDLAVASGAELFYSCFVGDFEFSVEDKDMSARFGWIPMLNVIPNLVAIARDLPSAGAASLYRFTESDDFIEFDYDEGDIRIRCSYTDVVVVVAHEDFRKAAILAMKNLWEDIVGDYPEISQNREMLDVIRRLDIDLGPSSRQM
jgi:hypothetical protein